MRTIPYQYAFYVKKNLLGRFINKVNENDSGGGGKVSFIEKFDTFEYLVMIERNDFYPYIINQLEEIGTLAR